MANYISNKEFTAAIIAYNKECDEREAAGLEINEIPKMIAIKFIELSDNLGSRYNFANYSYRDEMVSAAKFACCNKIRKFDCEKSNNAFAFFTNVCWRAMVDVINIEHENAYIKAKMFQGVDFQDAIQDSDLSNFDDHCDNMNDFIPYFDIAEYERKMAIRKEKSKQTAKKKQKNIQQLEM